MQTISHGIGKMLSMATRLATSLGVVVLLALGLLCMLDVLTTRVLDQPITGVIKLSEAGLALTLFLGLAIAVRSQSHVRVDLFVTRLGKHPRRVCHAIASLFTAAFFALWTFQMGLMAAQSWALQETATGMLAYPLYPIKWILFLGLLIATCEALRQLARSLAYLYGSNLSQPKDQPQR